MTRSLLIAALAALAALSFSGGSSAGSSPAATDFEQAWSADLGPPTAGPTEADPIEQNPKPGLGGFYAQWSANLGPPTLTVTGVRSVTPAEALAAQGQREGTPDATNACWAVEYTYGWGYWPTHRVLHGHTYWCATYGNDITYRVSQVWGTTDWDCWVEDTHSFRRSGGLGYSWVEVHFQAWFACHTPTWIVLHDSLYMGIAYNVWGSHAPTYYGRND